MRFGWKYDKTAEKDGSRRGGRNEYDNMQSAYTNSPSFQTALVPNTAWVGSEPGFRQSESVSNAERMAMRRPDLVSKERMDIRPSFDRTRSTDHVPGSQHNPVFSNHDGGEFIRDNVPAYTLARKPALWNWIQNIPQSEDDPTIQSSVKDVFAYAEQFVNNFYTDRPYQEMQPDPLIQKMNFTCLYPGQRLSDLLKEVHYQTTVIKHCIITIILSIISLQGSNDYQSIYPSLLPPEFTCLAAALKQHKSPEEDIIEHPAAFSAHRVLTSYLRSNLSTDRRYQARKDEVIESVCDSIRSAFKPWENPTKIEDSLLLNLIELLEKASKLGILLFSQPSTFLFRWDIDEMSHEAPNDSIPIWPMMTKVLDENAQPLGVSTTLIQIRAGRTGRLVQTMKDHDEDSGQPLLVHASSGIAAPYHQGDRFRLPGGQYVEGNDHEMAPNQANTVIYSPNDKPLPGIPGQIRTVAEMPDNIDSNRPHDRTGQSRIERSDEQRHNERYTGPAEVGNERTDRTNTQFSRRPSYDIQQSGNMSLPQALPATVSTSQGNNSTHRDDLPLALRPGHQSSGPPLRKPIPNKTNHQSQQGPELSSGSDIPAVQLMQELGNSQPQQRIDTPRRHKDSFPQGMSNSQNRGPNSTAELDGAVRMGQITRRSTADDVARGPSASVGGFRTGPDPVPVRGRSENFGPNSYKEIVVRRSSGSHKRSRSTESGGEKVAGRSHRNTPYTPDDAGRNRTRANVYGPLVSSGATIRNQPPISIPSRDSSHGKPSWVTTYIRSPFMR